MLSFQLRKPNQLGLTTQFGKMLSLYSITPMTIRLQSANPRNYAKFLVRRRLKKAAGELTSPPASENHHKDFKNFFFEQRGKG